MRRTASEILADLELRVASLEKQSARTFTLSVSYHTVSQPRGRNTSAEKEWHSKDLFEGSKKMFIPSKRPEFSLVEKFVDREVISKIKKLQKEIEDVFYRTNLDPTESRHTFESSGNKFEWVLVAQRQSGEVLQLAYVRTIDKSYIFYTAPAINIKVHNTSGQETKAIYLLNHLASELGMRTVRIG